MIGGRNAVRTTYRGYQLIIDANDILAIAPNGDTFCAPSISTVRSWVNQHRREGTKRSPTSASLPASASGAVPPADLQS